MDFDTHVAIVHSWLDSCSSFALLDVDYQARRLIFTVIDGEGSFYIVGPNKHENTGKDTWHLWTDHPGTLSTIFPVIEKLQTGSISQVEDVLSGIQEAMGSTTGSLQPPQATSSTFMKQTRPAEYHAPKSTEHSRTLPREHHGAAYERPTYDASEAVSTRLQALSLTRVPGLRGRTTHEEPQEEPQSADCRGPPSTLLDRFSSGDLPDRTARRLLKDLKVLQGCRKYGLVASPRGDNMLIWDVKLVDIPRDSTLGRDLVQYARRYSREECIQMEMIFPRDYPYKPPFIRFLRPRFEKFTGHVTTGGSICMDLLASAGWTPANSIETILIQVRTEILSDPRAALSPVNTDVPYDLYEARRGFDALVRRKGWDK